MSHFEKMCEKCEIQTATVASEIAFDPKKWNNFANDKDIKKCKKDDKLHNIL